MVKMIVALLFIFRTYASNETRYWLSANETGLYGYCNMSTYFVDPEYAYGFCPIMVKLIDSYMLLCQSTLFYVPYGIFTYVHVHAPLI